MMSGGYPYPFTSSPAQSSPWHSPVPYLFGGLAAMLGLIAFALLILACSYWKLSGYIDADDDDNNRSSGERDLELGHPSSGDKPKFEEEVLVIMAGEEKPTFLATRISCVTSFAGREENSGKEDGSGDPAQTGNMEIRETGDQVP